MKKSLFISMLAVFTLTACGGAESVWVHPSKDHQAFVQDREFCMRRINPEAPNYNDNIALCLGQMGWTQESY